MHDEQALYGLVRFDGTYQRQVTGIVLVFESAAAAKQAARTAAHIDRLAEALRFEPCSLTCTNWLLYGVEPKNTRPGLVPGQCTGKAHKRETLGFGGRRVLVSRRWSGKTLADHRQDRLVWVRQQLAALGHPYAVAPVGAATGSSDSSCARRPGDPPPRAPDPAGYRRPATVARPDGPRTRRQPPEHVSATGPAMPRAA